MSPRAVRAWTFAFLALVGAVCAAGVFIPLYSDEVAMQMARSRFLVEQGHLLNLLPQCRDLAQAVPASWVPGAVVNALLYASAGELGLRMRGVALCMLWLAVLWTWAGRHPQALLPRRQFQGLALSLNLVGVLPFVLMLARAEQLMVLALAGYCLLALHAPARPEDRPPRKLAKAALFLVITSVFLLAHPKALFFAPVVGVAAWLVFPRGGLWRIAVLAACGFMILQTFEHARAISNCSQAPGLARSLAQQTLDFGLLRTDRLGFAAAAWRNLSAAPGLILERLPLTATFQSHWLPTLDQPGIEPWLAIFGKAIALGVGLAVVLLVMGAVARVVQGIRRRHLDPATALAAALLLSLGVHLATYDTSIWHFYTPGLLMPALTLLLMLVLSGPPWAHAAASRRTAQVLAGGLQGFAVVSMLLLLMLVTPRLVQIARSGDYVIANQPLSTPVFLGDAPRAELKALASQCGIRDGDRRLVLDGSAYFAYQRGPQPINVLYVSSYALGGDLGDRLPQYLNDWGSAGVLSRCEFLPGVLRQQARASGPICCVPAAQRP